LLAVCSPTSANAAAWRSFGYPAQHTDQISTKDGADTAAFNLRCRTDGAEIDLELRSKIGMKNVPFTLSADGRTIGRGMAAVSGLGSVAFISTAASTVEARHWLNGIAAAANNVTVSVRTVGTGRFTVTGARAAAETALSYCKL
jgi:hypothetical protein